MKQAFTAIWHFFQQLPTALRAQQLELSALERTGLLVTAIVGLLFTLCYLHQFFYILLAVLRRPRRYPVTDQSKRYAAIIAARNEERVLPELLKSIASQSYPRELIEIFVVADNCTDGTAAVARTHGATVFERADTARVGKGYALAFLFDRIALERGLDAFDAYLVFDADNVLRPNYFEEMDKAYCAGNRIVTSYRNSKNYGSNWISAGYALWFMRESVHLNNPRSILGSSAAISGTGFLVDSEIVERNGGWRHFLLTEDIEFTADCIIRGERVGYCHAAELFDEQPETFRQSWRQRRRWAKGMFQVFRRYGGGLIRGSLGLRWSCFDMTMNIMPAFLLSSVQILAIGVLLLLELLLSHRFSAMLLGCFFEFFRFGYGIFWLLGALALISEWRRVHCSKLRAVLLLFTFPLFMLTYIPISISAFFSRHVAWKPVEHKHAMSVGEIENRCTSPSASDTQGLN